jgi:hypothetical protein
MFDIYYIDKENKVMNRQQKIAWFSLIIIALALVLSVTTFSIGFFILDVPARKASAGFAFMGIMGLIGLTPFLFKKDKDKVKTDERDLQITRKAMLAAYSIFWLLFVAAAMVPWFIIGPDGEITVNYLPWMVFGGMCIVMLLQSIVTLNEYGWREKG